MRKYSDAPKDLADAIKNAVPVSRKEGLGDDWKNLPYGDDRAKKRKRLSAPRSIPVSKEMVHSRRGKVKSFCRVKVGNLQLEVPGNASDAYTEALIDLLKDFLKKKQAKA